MGGGDGVRCAGVREGGWVRGVFVLLAVQHVLF